MITDNNYYIDEIYIPHAVREASDSYLDVKSSVGRFISKYERDCLLKSLGRGLFREFEQNIDASEPSKIKTGSDAKWDELMNGAEYTDAEGNHKSWRGIRFESIAGEGHDSSFLANYVYFFYEKNDDTTRTNVGNVKESAKNASRVSKMPKVSSAWNEFVGMVQGNSPAPNVFTRNGILGVDWYQGGSEVSLYEFINDKNKTDESTYSGFTPKTWSTINAYGL